MSPEMVRTTQKRLNFGSGKRLSANPLGLNILDDLDGDGIINEQEEQIKIEIRRKHVLKTLKQQILNEYENKFNKEVDIHHKIDYAFELAAKLEKEHHEKKDEADMEIIQLLREYSDYIQHDPLVLFYCLFFCVYFNNSFILDFVRTVILKM